MTYSHTQPLIIPTRGEPQVDPLYDAWRLVVAARRVPFDIAEGSAWVADVRDCLSGALRGIRLHGAATESRGSRLKDHAEEHEALSETASQLLAELNRTPASARGAVIALGERLIDLEIAMARHLNRLHAVLGREALARTARRS
ncbi:MAG TPA: hypothetical protein VFY90_11385 [Tepidiformaceae bacterium]|nr:hypothetical protein [Tepidiformaceae bacterium]